MRGLSTNSNDIDEFDNGVIKSVVEDHVVGYTSDNK